MRRPLAHNMGDQPNAGPVDPELDVPPSPLRRRSPPHAPLMQLASQGGSLGLGNGPRGNSAPPQQGPPSSSRVVAEREGGAGPGAIEAPVQLPLQPAENAPVLLPLFANPPANVESDDRIRKPVSNSGNRCSSGAAKPVETPGRCHVFPAWAVSIVTCQL